MVKMGAGLGRPIPMQREIRQGCPISGQLYSLGIEPLLCKLREWVSGLSMPGSLSLGHPPHVVSAYADDINIFVTSQGDEQHLRETLDMFQNASSAQVNWSKSEALLVGPWRDQVAPSLPGGLEWSREGLKVLGVYVGMKNFEKKNREGVKEKVCVRLSKWK